MLFKRREFIQTGSLATASFLVPKFLKAFEAKSLVPDNQTLQESNEYSRAAAQVLMHHLN